MINFNLDQFIKDQDLSILEFAEKIKVGYRSMKYMVDRGTVKPAFLRLLKKKFTNDIVQKYRQDGLC